MTIPSTTSRALATTSGQVELFTINFRGTLLNICNSENVGNSITYAGVVYTCFPVVMTGIETTTDGSLPRPTFTIGNTFRTVAQTFGKTDITGAKVTRILTFAEFLDGSPGASTSSYTSRTFYVDQKTSESQDLISFALATPLEVLGKKLPLQRVTHNIFPGASRY